MCLMTRTRKKPLSLVRVSLKHSLHQALIAKFNIMQSLQSFNVIPSQIRKCFRYFAIAKFIYSLLFTKVLTTAKQVTATGRIDQATIRVRVNSIKLFVSSGETVSFMVSFLTSYKERERKNSKKYKIAL